MISGGGTGGHIFPALAIGEALKERIPGTEVRFVGTRYGMETRLVPARGFQLLTLPMRGFLGKSHAQKLALLWRIPFSLLGSLYYLLRFRTKVVIGVGGYASAPLLWVAWLLRIPTMIQEQNAFPGMVNRKSARIVKQACLGFGEAGKHLACASVVTGNPVRADFQNPEPWSPDRNVVLILGGSQGAKSLNEILPNILHERLTSDHGLRVIHQCGKQHVAAVQDAWRDAQVEVEVTPFIEDMSAVFQSARLVICRAGASTIAELKMVGVPAVLIPFPQAAHDHQTFNAQSLAESGAALLIRENDLAQSADQIMELVESREKLGTMAQAYPPPQTDSAGLCADIALALERGEEVGKLVGTNGTIQKD